MHSSILQRANSTTRRPADARRGFALLITITLLAFLVLLLVSLATLTRVETQVAGNNQQLAQARQNALLALNLAIGQLQKHTGPDQRVTATADLQPLATSAAPATYPTTDPASGVNLAGAASNTRNIINSVDSYWKASRNRRWTGVWKNSNATDVSASADTPAAANPVAALQAWLVSGNEQAATFTPQTVLTGLSVTASGIDDSIKDASGTIHRLLVGPHSTGVATAADLDRLVTAPQQEIRANNVPGTDGTNTLVGHYAWWVGDEGVKARANLIDAYAGTGTDEANRIRLGSAQRPALEAMSVTGGISGNDDDNGLAPFKTTLANNNDLLKVVSQSQLSVLQNSSVLNTQLQKRWHDLSTTSRGVLSDARHGGLKTDLSYLLSRPTLTAFRTALNTALPGFAPNTSGAAYNRLLSTTVTPYATQPPLITSASGAFSGNAVYAGMDMFAYSATWEQLWSYNNLGNNVSASSGTPAGAFTASNEVRPRLQTGTQHGIDPLLVQVKLFYKLRLPGTVLDADGVDRTSEIWMDIIPVVVLANPYNVPLEAQEYYLLSSAGATGRVRLYYGIKPADPENPSLAPSSPSTNELTMNENGMGAVKLTIKAPRMEPGRAYVFTLENASTTIPSNPNATVAANLQKALVVNMVNDFNPANVLTYNTTKKIAASPATHAALTTDNGVLAFSLHTKDYTDTTGNTTLVRYLFPHTYVEDAATLVPPLVYPLSSGLRHGGGMGAFIHDASLVAKTQQSPLYQLNYRGIMVSNAAYTTFGTNPNGTGQKDISISWARTRVKSGATSQAGNDTPNEFIQSHLLWRDPSNPKEVRWGIYNTGEGFDGTLVPSALSGDAGLVNIFYDVPRAEHPLSSVFQLRHFNTIGHIPFTGLSSVPFRDAFAIYNHSFQPNYAIGNSYPNPFIIRQKVIDGDGGMGFQYDGSYLFNEALQDRFFFSTFPASGAFDFATGKLVNNRNRPFRPTTSVAWDEPANFRTDSFSASKNLLVDGAFNINSTSVEAWKALLSSVKNVPVGGETGAANLSAPFARTLFQTGGTDDSRKGNSVNAWSGTINLTATEIDTLAYEIVLQVRRRGPFLSVADFTNRRIIAASADSSFGLGLGGALQAAIDRILNQATDVQPASLRKTSTTRAGDPTATPPVSANLRLAENAFVMPTGISGSSGYILQSDILSNIGPVLAARSDTFTIRTYGDVTNPATGTIEGRAWCEAVVQRTPDYVVPKSAGGNDAEETPVAGSTNAIFGRHYEIVRFRWLTPNDL